MLNLHSFKSRLKLLFFCFNVGTNVDNTKILDDIININFILLLLFGISSVIYCYLYIVLLILIPGVSA